MNVFSKVYENALSFIHLFILNSHDLCDEKIYKLQNKKLKKLMNRAYQIPLYRKKFEEAGLRPEDITCREDLAAFPVLTKQEIKGWLTPLLSEVSGKYHVFSTSGSTGTPLKVLVSPKENSYLTANWLRMAMKQGINPFFQKTMALKDPELVAQGSDSIIQKLGILRRRKFSFLADGKEIAEGLNQYEPDFFYAHRTKLLQMIEYAQKNNVKLHHPAAYAVISEMMLENDEKLFRQNLGDNIFTSYGCMETGACTYTVKGDLTRHIITNDTHIINVVDDHSKLAKKGKMLLTNLNFLDFPIINYDVGDDAEVFEENGVEYISQIHGRSNDWVELDDGRKYDYHPFYRAFEGENDVLHFRVIQEDYHKIIIQLVGRPAMQKGKQGVIEQHVIQQLNKVIEDYDMDYMFDWRNSIEPDQNGKTRFIVSKINKDDKIRGEKG